MGRVGRRLPMRRFVWSAPAYGIAWYGPGRRAPLWRGVLRSGRVGSGGVWVDCYGLGRSVGEVRRRQGWSNVVWSGHGWSRVVCGSLHLSSLLTLFGVGRV